MPQFYPAHTPRAADAFTRGYLDCAEWLLDEETDRDKLRGWTRAAIRQASDDCADFQQANAAALARYEEVTGRDMESAGMDFWLTRNRHGAGFWDRGDDACLRELTDAAHAYGTVDTQAYRGWLYLYP